MRLKTIAPEEARGMRRALMAFARRQYGVVPGMMRIALVDLRLGLLIDQLYRYLHMRRRSPLSRVQREMLATVVNGLVGGAP